MDFTLTNEDKQVLLHTAREAIFATLEERPSDYPHASGILQTTCGAFVTLHERGALRGCIGHIIGHKPLIETVKEMAVASAFQDPRFPPLRKKEADSIDIEISVLSPLEKIDSVDTIVPGKHGIYIKRGSASGVLLPQVATEQGWDRETFLTHTCYKAGLRGACWKNPDTEIYIFTAVIIKEK